MFLIVVSWDGDAYDYKILRDSNKLVLLFSSAHDAHEYMRIEYGAKKKDDDGVECGDLSQDKYDEGNYYLDECRLLNSPAPKFVHMADPHTLRLAFEGDKYDGMTPADYGTDRP